MWAKHFGYIVELMKWKEKQRRLHLIEQQKRIKKYRFF